MAESLIFYTNPMSRGQIVRWMLEEVGEPYETRIIGYDEMGGDAYRAVNPMMKVPAIVHEGKTVTECAAIIAYLADAFPAAGLAPRDDEKADYYRWLFFTAGPIEQAVTARSFKFEPDEEQQRSAGFGSYERAMGALADHLAGRDYTCGERFTAADVYVGSHVMWGLQFGTFPDRKEFTDYAARLGTRDAYRRGKEIDNGLIADMKAASPA